MRVSGRLLVSELRCTLCSSSFFLSFSPLGKKRIAPRLGSGRGVLAAPPTNIALFCSNRLRGAHNTPPVQLTRELFTALLHDERIGPCMMVSRYTSVNATDPSRYAAHQWLQSARVFPNGSGAALVHSEFHGDNISPQNASLCSYNLTHPAPNGECQLWSTSLAVTSDGGTNWRMVRDPPELSLVFAAPRRYVKDQPISGFGALGAMIELDGYFFGHVQESHVGPAPGSGPTGVCAFRTPDVFDPTACVVAHPPVFFLLVLTGSACAQKQRAHLPPLVCLAHVIDQDMCVHNRT
jgi:hypothetical protein